MRGITQSNCLWTPETRYAQLPSQPLAVSTAQPGALAGSCALSLGKDAALKRRGGVAHYCLGR